MANKTKIWYLQNISLFKGFTQEQMAALDRVTSMTSAKRKNPIYLPGDPSRQVYLLKSGRVKISRTTEDGKELTLALLKPGDIFGEAEVLDDLPRDTLAEALDDTQLCVIQREDFMAMLNKSPDLTLRLAKLIGSRLRSIEIRIEDLVYRDVPARLAHLLLELSKEFGMPEKDGVRIGIRLTHQEIANLIGSTRETVTATMGEFRKRGLLGPESRDIVLTKPQELSGVTGPSSLNAV
jgi:CRP/FNR family transcriptional regulator, cyclic AMP receptor protein